MSASKEVHRLIKNIGTLSGGQASIEDVNWEDGNIGTFKIVLKPNSGYYKGGRFEFQVFLDDQYPNTTDPPKVRCLTDIYHPNIYTCEDSSHGYYDRNICLNLLDKGTWDPAFGLGSIVLGLLFLLSNPNLDSIVHHELSFGEDDNEKSLDVESHGIVGNFMYDEETGDMFDLAETARSLIPHWWKGAEAFYISAEKQGLKIALYDWRGCQVERDGWSPTFCKPFTEIPTRQDSRNVIYDCLQRLTTDSTDIVYVYHEQVDHQGHLHGPDSEVVRQTIQELDDDIDELLDNITTMGLDDINIILVSDHGMTAIDEDQIIDISGAIDIDDIIKITEGGTETYVWPVKVKEKKVYIDLQQFSNKYDVFNRADISEDWFLKKHRLMSPILVLANTGWFVKTPKLENQKFIQPPKGNHGFETKEENMRSIFLVIGPDFKRVYISAPFNNINVYQVVCHVTGIRPPPHNGTWSEVKDMLINPEPMYNGVGYNTGKGTHSEL